MSKLIPPLTVLVAAVLIALGNQQTTVTYKKTFAEKEIQLTETVSYWRYLLIKVQEL